MIDKGLTRVICNHHIGNRVACIRFIGKIDLPIGADVPVKPRHHNGPSVFFKFFGSSLSRSKHYLGYKTRVLGIYGNDHRNHRCRRKKKGGQNRQNTPKQVFRIHELTPLF